MPLSIARNQSTHRHSRSPRNAPPPRLREVAIGSLRIGDEFVLRWNQRGGTVVGFGTDVHVVLDGESPRDQDARFSPALGVLATGKVSPFYRQLRQRRAPGRRRADRRVA